MSDTRRTVKISELEGYKQAKEIANEWNDMFASLSYANDLKNRLAMSRNTDPFYMTAGKVLKGSWARNVMDNIIKPHLTTIGINNIHLRDIHYILTGRNIAIWDGSEIYENTMGHWQILTEAFGYARYLGMVNSRYIRDNKNKVETRSYYWDDDKIEDKLESAKRGINKETMITSFTNEFDRMIRHQQHQPYHIELWLEKDLSIAEQVAKRYQINTVTGEGETSITQIYEIVNRIKQAGKPVRIGYIADCDVVGSNMSKAMARKVEFILRKEGIDLDIKITHLMLTPTQVKQYNLPTIPMKTVKNRNAGAQAYEVRKDKWTQARGLQGAVEINSFHSLHPNSFRAILENFIENYYDHDVNKVVNNLNKMALKMAEEAVKGINFDSLIKTFKSEVDKYDWKKKMDAYNKKKKDELLDMEPMDTSQWDEDYYQWLLDSELDYDDQYERYMDYEEGLLDNPEE